MDLELSGKRALAVLGAPLASGMTSNDLGGVTRDADKRAGRSAGKSENQPRGGALGWRLRDCDDDSGLEHLQSRQPKPCPLIDCQTPSSSRPAGDRVSSLRQSRRAVGRPAQSVSLHRSDGSLVPVDQHSLSVVDLVHALVDGASRPLSAAPVALVVYGTNLIAATLVLALHWHYATARDDSSALNCLHASSVSRIGGFSDRRVPTRSLCCSR